MSEGIQAKRFVISGVVQGVGFRYFAQRVAGRLGLAGYVKNLRDGRVEVYGIGPPGKLSALRAELARGPHAAVVEGIAEEEAPIDRRYADGFTIEMDGW